MDGTRPNTAPSGWDGILDPGERILWQGRPDGTLELSGIDLRRAAFGFAIMAFAAFWTSAALSTAPSGLPRLILCLAGLLLLGIGLRHAGGHLIWDAYRRRRTWYTLTNRRAMIATDMAGRKKLESYPIEPETAVTLVRGSPGNILFATVYQKTKQGSRRRRIGFERLHDAGEIYDLMRRVQRGGFDDAD